MRNLLLVILLFINLPLLAQHTIKGRVVDSHTQEGIAYTNIGVEGTLFGTASDAQGFFELKIPDDLKDKKLLFSAVGYQNQTLKIQQLLQQEFHRIQLVGQTYNINNIDVEAQSRVMFRIVKTAAANISENYQKGPFSMKFYYAEMVDKGDSLKQKREAVVNLYDETGYASPSVEDAYKSRNYEFAQVKKNFESYSFPSGETGFDELLNMDVVRLSNSLLNKGLLNEFDLQLEGVSKFQNDSVWIISYKTAQPDIAHSGDFYGTKMEGKIYISKSNYQVLRNECVIEASKNNPQDRSLFTKGNDQSKVNYHMTAIYKPYKGKYALSYLDCDKTYVNAEGQKCTYSRRASVLDVNTNSPQKINGKTYFENTAYIESFWNSFQRPE